MGTVARAFYPRMDRLPLDWSRVSFFRGDERSVPATDPESYYGVALALWLAPARVPAASIHRMRADSPDLDQAGADYAGEMVRVLGTPPRLDLALLGVGPDGHVAYRCQPAKLDLLGEYLSRVLV